MMFARHHTGRAKDARRLQVRNLEQATVNGIDFRGIEIWVRVGCAILYQMKELWNREQWFTVAGQNDEFVSACFVGADCGDSGIA